MKLTKRIAAIGAAVVMSISMMSIGAGAYSWNVSYTPSPGMPSNTPISASFTSDWVKTSSETGYSKMRSACTYFSSTEDADGNPAYISYYCRIYNSDKTTVLGTTSTKYHYQVSNPSSGTVTNLPCKFKYGLYAKMTYKVRQVNNYGVTMSARGTYTFSN